MPSIRQYGFGQTDSRADIYAFGVLLHWLATGSARANDNITIDADLQRVINRCTAFSPEQRFPDIAQVRKTLQGVGRSRRRVRLRTIITLELAALLLLCAGFAAGRYRMAQAGFNPRFDSVRTQCVLERLGFAWD